MESLLFSKNISLSYIIKVNGFYDMFTCMFCFESWINLIATFFIVVHDSNLCLVYCACQLRLVQYHERNFIREFLVPQDALCYYHVYVSEELVELPKELPLELFSLLLAFICFGLCKRSNNSKMRRMLLSCHSFRNN